MHLAVVAPVVRQGDGREVALRLGGRDEGVHVPGAPRRGGGRRAEARRDRGTGRRARRPATTRRPATRVAER